MLQIQILNDGSFTSSEILQNAVKNWLDTKHVNESIKVVDIKVDTISTEVEETIIHNRATDRDKKTIKNKFQWYATIIYDDMK